MDLEHRARTHPAAARMAVKDGRGPERMERNRDHHAGGAPGLIVGNLESRMVRL